MVPRYLVIALAVDLLVLTWASVLTIT